MKTNKEIFSSTQEIIKQSIKNNIPFVSFFMPGSKTPVTYIQFKALPKIIKLQDINLIQSGFVFSPFIESPENPTYLLEPDYIHTGNVEIPKEIVEAVQKKTVSFPNDTEKTLTNVTSEMDFEDHVIEIKKQIASGIIQKAVLSRVTFVPANAEIEFQKLFGALKGINTRSFRYLIHIPGSGMWAGATPEALFTIAGNKATIMSIAGTKKLNGVSVKNVNWEQKEIDEQNIVTQYIENKLNELAIPKYKVKGPESVEAVNLIHLKTSINFELPLASNYAGRFIQNLHPTPSVCGTPVDKSKDLILNLEKHQREYYTGFLGPLNIEGETQLFVNLRCMKVEKKGFTIFAGAGITSGSDPVKEWEETNQKLQTMLKVIEESANIN